MLDPYSVLGVSRDAAWTKSKSIPEAKQKISSRMRTSIIPTRRQEDMFNRYSRLRSDREDGTGNSKAPVRC